MKESTVASIARRFERAEPIPTVTLGYLLGLFLSFGFAFSSQDASLQKIVPLSFLSAISAYTAAELPFWIACTLSGFCRLPRVTALPVFFRSLLWGYSSLPVYLAVGKGILYFTFVVGSSLTLLPLCCLTKLAEKTASSPKMPSGRDHFRYLCQCLYFWGLTLILLLLRSIAGVYLCS